MDAPTPVTELAAPESAPSELSVAELLGEIAGPVPAVLPGAWRAHLAGVGAVLRFGGLLLVAYSLFFNLSVVRGSSMTPGIQDGDRILVEPWSYLLGPIERGDVVVLRYPLDPDIDYIKRIIGLPGDRVRLSRGEVWVNDALLEEPYVEAVDPTTSLSIEVESGNYFVLGDNRPRSSDSREFGLVPEEHVRGRVDLRLWPPGRAGLID
jgi:signal peptidase I